MHPGATVPFGMVNAVPHTETLDWANMGYNRSDSAIVGFVHNQVSGIGSSEYGNLLVTPVRYPVELNEYQYASKRGDESAEPGYYRVRFDRYTTEAEVTTTGRVAYHRYRFQDLSAGDTLAILINMARASHPQQVTESSIQYDRTTGLMYATGTYNGGFATEPPAYRIWTVVEPTIPPDTVIYYRNGEPDGENRVDSESGEHLIGALIYRMEEGVAERTLELRVTLSYIGFGHADEHLSEAHSSYPDFESAKAAAKQQWDDLYGRVNISGGTEAERTLFATAWYRMFQMPTDITGEAPEPYRYTFTNYFAIWDTFRTLHPFFTLFEPTLQAEMLNSLIGIAERFEWLPDGFSGNGLTTIQGGTNADVLFADAVAKGLEGVDYQRVWPYLLRNATRPTPDTPGSQNTKGRYGEYLTNGWLNADDQWASVSKSLEYAYNDYAVARVGQQLGYVEEIRPILDRSRNILALFDNETGFFRPKKADGTWVTPFDPAEMYPEGNWSYAYHFYEGSAWQYLGYAPHMIPKLITELGGEEAFIKKWTTFFENRDQRGFYTTSNEPDIMAPYQFIYAGRPDLTQYWIRELQREEFRVADNGWPGNDDSGTLSAWYVWSAMGLFPNPGQDWYFIGTPMFDHLELTLENGEKLRIEAPGASFDRRYISSVQLNGEELDRAFLYHHQIEQGGILFFTMSSEPTEWASDSLPPDAFRHFSGSDSDSDRR